MRPSLRLTAAQMAAFAERLKQLRTERKLTQARLAELLTVGIRVYHRWENGDATPHLDTLVKIAEVLDVSADELLGIENMRDDHRIHNHELHQLVQQVDQLSDDDQRALIAVMDGLVKRTQIGKMARNSPSAADRKSRGPRVRSESAR